MRQEPWILAVGMTIALSMLPTAAFAFQPDARRWPGSPERFARALLDHDAPKLTRALAGEGLRAVSFRPDGSPALITVLGAGTSPAPLNISAESAERRALGLARSVARELGVDGTDLVVGGSTALDGFTTVSIEQRFRGMRVVGGVMMFVFHEGQLAQLRNELVLHGVTKTEGRISAVRATEIAFGAARELAPDSALVRTAEIEIWTSSDRAEDARLAYVTRTESYRPRTRLDVVVDAETGEILAVDDEVRRADGEGRVRIVVDAATVGSPQVPFSARYLKLDAAGATDGDGEARRNGSVQVSYVGPTVRINDQTGAASEVQTIAFSGPYRAYDLTPQDFTQADPFIHINVVKAFARSITPSMAWLDQVLDVNVNLNDSCNAFWDGTTVNFFRAGSGCNNTGRIASIVYHEFGHGYHQHLTTNVVGSVGEGSGDYLAATILDDPIVGRGFSVDGAAIRRIDQVRRFPENYVGEVHQDGLIWASALWSLRSAMIQKHGPWAGRIIANRIFVLALTQGPGLSTAYPSVLAADDDDGDLLNGTPNSCEINAVFDQHGLIQSGQITNPRAAERAFVRVTHRAPGRFIPTSNGGVQIDASAANRSTCGSFSISGLTLHHAPGLTGGAWQTVPMVATTAQDASTILTGVARGEDFRYWFSITAGGTTFTDGSAEKPHVGHVGDYTDIAVEDFESGQGPSGLGTWRHGTLGVDRVDDWEAAVPIGQGFDPYEAHGGARVAGTDLGSGGGPGGTDGIAKPGRNTFLESAPIPTTGMEGVRLELWQHYAISGTLKILVDGREIWNRTVSGLQDGSGGWRFLSLPLGDAARDKAAGVVVRFEVATDSGNTLGGWAIDDVAVVGTAIPPPPPTSPTSPPPDAPPSDRPPGGSVESPTPRAVPGAPIQDPAQTGPGAADSTRVGPTARSASSDTENAIQGGCACVPPSRARHPITTSAALFVLGFLAALMTHRGRRPRSEHVAPTDVAPSIDLTR